MSAAAGRRACLLFLVCASLAAACGKKGKNDDTNTPGKSSAAVTDPSKASAEAKASFNEVAQRYKTAKERGSLSAATCEDISKDFLKVYKDYGAQMAVAKFNAGAVWEECGNAEKAEDIYQQLVQEYGGTPAADYAEQMLTQLPQ